LRKYSFLIISFLTAILLATMFGCGEEEKETARIVQTDPADGKDIFVNEDMVITFDTNVTEVKVNGTQATIDGSKAIWKAQGLQTGEQTLNIEWTDENGNSGSQDMEVTVKSVDGVIC
jgi:hypothetical protein